MMRLPLLLSAVCLLPSPVISSTAGADTVVEDFESTAWGDWSAEGEAFGPGPVPGTLPNQMQVSGYAGERLVNSYHGTDATTGTLTSPPLTITDDFLSFLIGGGNQADQVGVELLIGGERRRAATGTDSESLTWVSWDVAEFRGQTARVRLFDQATGSWGHLLFDELTLTGESRERVEVGRLSDYRESAAWYRERYRPRFHFTPEINWMNDPNGLVFHDGEYHLFYQHNPHGNEWGHMSWGHAVSGDLCHWRHLPIALHDEYGVMAFSGSAVVDNDNTSGFGTADNPPLVAIYTGHGHGRQTQDLAYSRDRGRTWTKYVGNPVLDLNKADFRDPKVFRHAPSDQWVMVVSLAADRILQFYGSPNLKDWNLLSEFGPAGVADKPNWECPDLFELPIEDEPGRTRWVLEADMGSGSVAGGSGGEYFTGTFDGTTFHADSRDSRWVDYGRDFYAPVSWSGIPERDGRRIWIGWMNNWETCLNPTYPWRSAMSVPRTLSLRRIDGTLRLIQRPVRELRTLRSAARSFRNVTVDGEHTLPLRGQALWIDVTLRPQASDRCGLRLLQSDRHHTDIGYDRQARAVFIDRTQSGNVEFHPAFAGRHTAPVSLSPDGTLTLTILVDACSVEVFAGDGAVVLTDLVFPDADGDQLELFSDGGACTVTTCEIATMRSVWPPVQAPVHAPAATGR